MVTLQGVYAEQESNRCNERPEAAADERRRKGKWPIASRRFLRCAPCPSPGKGLNTSMLVCYQRDERKGEKEEGKGNVMSVLPATDPRSDISKNVRCP